jgi:hypothetical protein
LTLPEHGTDPKFQVEETIESNSQKITAHPAKIENLAATKHQSELDSANQELAYRMDNLRSNLGAKASNAKILSIVHGCPCPMKCVNDIKNNDYSNDIDRLYIEKHEYARKKIIDAIQLNFGRSTTVKSEHKINNGTLDIVILYDKIILNYHEKSICIEIKSGRSIDLFQIERYLYESNKQFSIIPARARDNRGKYCSLKCRREDSKTIMVECIICHKPQKRYRSTLHKYATLCSKTCESKWKSSRTNFYTDEYRKEHRIECRCKQCGKRTVVAKANKFVFCDKKCYSGYMTKGEYRVCKTCGKEFWGIRSYIEKGWDIFCSKICAREADKTGEYRNCVRCDKKFYISDWYVKNGYGKYCSRTCLDYGLTDLYSKIRASDYHTRWHRLVLKKDEFTCQNCGQKHGDLEAHHLVPFAKILRDNSVTTLEEAKNCEFLWDIDNGQTLCMKCHLLVTAQQNLKELMHDHSSKTANNLIQ